MRRLRHCVCALPVSGRSERRIGRIEWGRCESDCPVGRVALHCPRRVVGADGEVPMVQKPYLFANDLTGRRADVVALTKEAEARGFPGVFSESPGDNLALSLAVLDRTERIVVGTGIAGIYLRHPHTMATGASLVEELHPGRFLLGLGISHVPFHEEMGVRFGRPLEDMRPTCRPCAPRRKGRRVLPSWLRRCASA